jgi:hypothetical protein
MEKTNIKDSFNIVTIILLLIVAGGGFFGGMKYQQSQTLSPKTQMAGQFGQNRAGGTNRAGGARGGQVLGTILSIDSKSMTVQMPDGSSKIVILSATTSINQAAVATVNDLKVGTKVSAFGTPNTDGSVTAQNIQINPIMRDITPTGTIKSK